MQDAASGVALWRQVADGIERGIADGSFAAGEKLPGEMEIAETYRVNRHTVRRALATLAERGLVRAERGSGTYVEAPRLAYPLALAHAVFRNRRRRRPRAARPADRRVAKSPRRANWRGSWLEDRRAADPDRGAAAGRPHADLRQHHLAVRGAVSRSRAASMQRMRSMTKLLAHYGIRDYRRASTRITAAIVDATDAARLELALGRPVLVVDSTDVDTDGRPLADQALALCRRAHRIRGGEQLIAKRHDAPRGGR